MPLALALLLLGSACRSDSAAPSATSPIPRSVVTSGTSVARAFPTTCDGLIATEEVNALVGAGLIVSGSSPSPSAGGQTLTCRYAETAGARPELSVVIVATEYADAASATTQDTGGRRTVEAQGGSFAPVERVGEEAYSFVYTKLFGVSARLGRHTVTLGIGRGLRAPTTEAVNTTAQDILSNLGR